MREYPIGYKVLRVSGCELWSATGARSAVRYSQVLWTAPEKDNGPLCVFDTLKVAVDWKRAMESADWIKCHRGGPMYVIWECRYERSPHDSIWFTYYSLGALKAPHEVLLHHLPTGTVLARKVRLLKEVAK